MTTKLAILGCGTMGRAVLGGLQRAAPGEYEAVATARRAELRERIAADHGVAVTADNAAAAAGADVILIAVKPQAAGDLLNEPGMRAALSGKLLVSLCAGVHISQLRGWAPEARVIRAMPNTPALIGEGMTVLSASVEATAEDASLVAHIFGAVGRVRVLDEKHLDAVTGLSGSGPAFACVMLEALADGGVMMGLPRDVALELAAQTMQGAARMVLATGQHPAALRDSVTTPAGCTIAGLFKMEEGRVRSILAQTVQEATRVAAGLGVDKRLNGSCG